MANEYSGLFTTPDELRQQRLDALTAQAAQQRTMGGSMSGLLGQVAAGTGGVLAEGIAGMFGLQTAAEKQAAQSQQILSGIDTTDPISIAKGIEAAQLANLPKVVDYLQGKASAAKAAARKITVEDRDYMLKFAAEKRMQGKSDAEVRKIVAEADKLEQTTPLEVRLKQAEASLSERTLDDKVSTVKAELADQLAQTKLTETETQRVSQQIAYAADLQPTVIEQAKADLSGTKLANDLNALQIKKGSALLPFEIASAALGNTLTTEQIAKVKADTAVALDQLKKGPTTDYLTELDRAHTAGFLSDEEYGKRLTERVSATSKTGGVAGEVLSDSVIKARLAAIQSYTDGMANAKDGLITSEQMFKASKEMTQGFARDFRSGLNDIMVKAGYGDRSRAAADQMYDVLEGKLTLENADALKGSFSDKDIAFLKSQLPAANRTPVGIQTAFARLSAKKYAAYEARRAATTIIGNAVDNNRIKESSALSSQAVRADLETFLEFRQLGINAASAGYKGLPLSKQISASELKLFTEARERLIKLNLIGDNTSSYAPNW